MDSQAAALIFYDIAHRPPVEETCCSPNPWKTRYALNFKSLPYKTSWVSMPDIARVRRSLNAPATRHFADGSDFYTLPVIHDAATGATVADTFDIAVYLQRTYPESGDGDLLPAQPLDLNYVQPQGFPAPLSVRPDGGFPQYARFNVDVDAVFTSHTPLMVHGLPLDPATRGQTEAEFVRRAGLSSWDDFELVGEARDKMLASFQRELRDLARLFRENDEGPYVLGQQASYADFIVGGWLRMAQTTLPGPEWEELRGWYDGVFGRLHDALERYAEVK